MILFQSQIAEHQQLAEHYRELAAKREALAQSFIEVESQAQTDLGSLKALVEKCSSLGGNNAIASLKTAVLELFGTDDGNEGGNQPTPTPDDDPDEPELLCLNGETGDCLTTADLDDSDLEPDIQLIVGVCPSGNVHTQESPDNPLADDHVLSSGAELNRQTCSIDPDLHWENTAPDGSSWEIATPLVCLLWMDAPLLGQHCTITSIATEQNENKCTQEGEQVAYCELVNVTDAIAYQRKTATGEIICTYIGFRTKSIAQSWMEFFEAISSKLELRQAKRMQGFKWEMKVRGLSIKQIERYAKDCDFAKSYNSTESPAQVAGLEPPSGWKQVQIEREPLTCILEEGDVVEVLSSRHAGYEGHVGTLKLISQLSELPLCIKFANGHVRYYQRTELKFITKGETEASTKPGLRTGQVLMGNRVVTTGAYVGVTRRSRISNARRGTADKVAAMQLVRDGLDPEQALAVIKGESLDDASDF
jgi:hypothetical protein